MGPCIGLYIHVPFCRKKCRYCDFYSIDRPGLENAYTDALKKEMDLCKGYVMDTLYIGGGTPSFLPVENLVSIIDHATKVFQFAESLELTLEINPGTITAEVLKVYRSAGVNRLNIGIQSFQDHHLDLLGRIHTAEEGTSAINAARSAGFDNLGVDLIIGLPGQDKTSLKNDLLKTLSFRPEHISCYMLTYEPGTPLSLMKEKGDISPLDDDTVGDLYLALVDYLVGNGYDHYEISNFAANDSLLGKSAFRSRHNCKYWTGAPYIGLGPSAHSYLPPVRSWNVSNIDAYIRLLNNRQSAVEEKETLTVQEEITETIYLSLRTGDGLKIASFRDKFGLDFKSCFRKVLSELEREGYVNIKKDRVCLTREGILVSDAVCVKLMEGFEKIPS